MTDPIDGSRARRRVAQARRRARRRVLVRRLVALAGVVVLVGVIVALAVSCGKKATTTQASGSSSPTPRASATLASAGKMADISLPKPDPSITLPHDLGVLDQLTKKADLLQKLPYTPQLLILGGSRSLRFEPSYLQHKTGLKGFNAGVRNGRPEEAWAWLNFFHKRYPKVQPRVLWLVHVRFLHAWDEMTLSLLRDPRFNVSFPPKLVQQQLKLYAADPHLAQALAANAFQQFQPDGHLATDKPNTPATRAFGIKTTIYGWKTRDVGKPGSFYINKRPKQYFEKTLSLLNHLGVDPVLVIMPMQPKAFAAVQDRGWPQAYKATTTYLHSLKSTYDFRLFDFHDIKSFGGDPDQFYDGDHMTKVNDHRLVDEILREDPDAFK